LPQHIREQAREAHRTFLRNPGHPALRFKKLEGSANLWSVRIGIQYRAVGIRKGDTVEWFWVGSHNDFDRAF
jgi:hypothetical protein